MTAVRLTLGLLLVTVAIAASACGSGSDSVATGSVANVDGSEITKAELDKLVAQAKRGYESQNQTFPKAGTPEYQSLQQQYVAYLVELAEFRKAADNLGVAVTDKDIDKIESQTIKEKFDGKRTEYEKALKKAGFTTEDYRANALAVSALTQKIFDTVTKDADVSEQDVFEYYTANQSQYGTPDSRDVRHILIAIK